MIGWNLDVKVNISSSITTLNRLAGRFSNWIPIAGGRLDVAVRDFLRRRFESEGRVGGGGKWVQLAPHYAAFKKLRVGTRKLLQYSGSMMEAFTRRRAQHQILRATRDTYELTVDEEIQPRARAHQHGVQKKGIPIRIIVPVVLPKNFMNDLKGIIQSYVIHGET